MDHEANLAYFRTYCARLSVYILSSLEDAAVLLNSKKVIGHLRTSSIAQEALRAWDCRTVIRIKISLIVPHVLPETFPS